MSSDLTFAVELAISGLLNGVMYALVALGFVLIYKSSAVFNFAQGAMTLFAALALVGVQPYVGLPAAVLVSAGVMIAIAFGVERVILRPLAGRPPLSIFMATIGLAFVLQGVAQAIWTSEPRGLDLGLPLDPVLVGELLIGRVELYSAAAAAVLVAVLIWFFQGTRLGLGLRAVADDHRAAASVGISLNRAWSVAWSVAGVVSVVAGIAWGMRLGVHFSLVLIAFKALPVLIIGGIDSIAGAIVAGLLVGAVESLADGFIGPAVGGGVIDFFPYLVGLVVLLVRPYGLFGREAVERV